MEKRDRNKWTNKFRELGKKKGSRADFVKIYKEMKKEKDIQAKISQYKAEKEAPFLEDDKKDISAKKSQYQAEITRCRIERLRIESLKSQVLAVDNKIKSQKVESIEERYALFGNFFKITKKARGIKNIIPINLPHNL